MMKRLFGVALIALTLGIYSLSDAQNIGARQMTTIPIVWEHACASCVPSVRNVGQPIVAVVDTNYTSHAGSSNATRDSSQFFYTPDMAPPTSLGVGDSTLAMKVSIWPIATTAVTVSVDSAYLYIESLDQQGKGVRLTNLTEIVGLANTDGAGTTNGSITWPITWAKSSKLLQSPGPWRVIIRGDHAGQFAGEVSYWKNK